MADVGKLLEEEEYGNESFEAEEQHKGPHPPSGKSSFLADAARAVAREEETEVKSRLEEGAKALRNAPLDPLAAAAIEYAGDSSDDDEGNGDAVTVAHSINLQVSCFRGDMRKAQAALEDGGSLGYKDRHGWNPLHWAASSNSYDVLRLLLKRGAADMASGTFRRWVNGQALDTGWTPLHVAVVKCSLDAIEVLLDVPAVSKQVLSKMGETPADCIPTSDNSPQWRLVRKALGVLEEKPVEESKGEGKEDEDEEKEGETDVNSHK